MTARRTPSAELFMDRMNEILNRIVEICGSDDGVTQIMLFGSRAKGTAMERSDIDIALIGQDIDMEKLRDDVDRIDTLLKIDLVDFNGCKNEALKNEVSKDGVTIYGKTKSI